MSTFRQLREAWEEWAKAALPQVQSGWANDPQDMAMKLPVVLEMDGPTTISNPGAQDYIGYANEGDEVRATLHSHRAASMFLRATSRDNISHPAELTIERVRAALRRPSLRAILAEADCAILSVGTTVRYPVTVNGRRESVAAVEVRINWRWDDEGDSQTELSDGTIEQTEITPTVDGDEAEEPWQI